MTQGAADTAKLQNLFGQAVGYHQSDRLDEAEKLYRAVLDIDPKQADSLYLLGLIARERGRRDDAIALIGQALAIDGANAMYHSTLGALYQEQGRLDEAVASIGHAIDIEPDYAEAHSNLGNALRDQGKTEDAAASYERALKYKPSFPVAHNNLAIVRKEQGRYEDAVAGYRRAITLQPNYADAYNNLGNALGELDRMDEAAAAYHQAIALRPGYADAYNNLGAVLHEQNKLAEARTSYDRAIALRPDFTDAHINLGSVLIDQGEREKAIEAAKIAQRLNPPPGPLEFSLGDLLLKCGIEDEAAEYLQRYLRTDPDDRKGARLLLAKLGAAPLPERAPDAFLDRVYGKRAAYWDLTATHDQPYRGATLVAEAVERICGENLDILDAGCGTGLTGALLKKRARRLDGIDLSAPMLNKAREKNIYDALDRGDMVAAMNARPGRYDVVASAATLIHFGDLKPVLDAAATTLRNGGIFAFTLFPNDKTEGPDVAVADISLLAYGGCYAHREDYVARTAKEAGFSVESLTRETHEHHRGQPIQGLVVTLRK